MSNEIKDSVTSAIQERLSHPVMGIFSIVWVITNWRFFFFLVVDKSEAGWRIEQACQLYASWSSMLLIPVVIAGAYIVLAPLLKVAALRYDRFVRNKDAVKEYQDALQITGMKLRTTTTEILRLEEKLMTLKNDVRNEESKLSNFRPFLVRREALFRSTEGLRRIVARGLEMNKRVVTDRHMRDDALSYEVTRVFTGNDSQSVAVLEALVKIEETLRDLIPTAEALDHKNEQILDEQKRRLLTAVDANDQKPFNLSLGNIQPDERTQKDGGSFP